VRSAYLSALWNSDANGNSVGNVIGVVAGEDPAPETAEPFFRQGGPAPPLAAPFTNHHLPGDILMKNQ
jgi:hypothetical protein